MTPKEHMDKILKEYNGNKLDELWAMICAIQDIIFSWFTIEGHPNERH